MLNKMKHYLTQYWQQALAGLVALSLFIGWSYIHTDLQKGILATGILWLMNCLYAVFLTKSNHQDHISALHRFLAYPILALVLCLIGYAIPDVNGFALFALAGVITEGLELLKKVKEHVPSLIGVDLLINKLMELKTNVPTGDVPEKPSEDVEPITEDDLNLAP